MSERLSLWLERITNSNTLTLGGSAILVGLATGAGVWLFKWLIEVMHSFVFGFVNGWTVALIPVIGGFIVGLVAQYFIGNEKLLGTRGGQVFIPRGETLLRAGDALVVVAEGSAREEVLRLCHQPDGELIK